MNNRRRKTGEKWYTQYGKFGLLLERGKNDKEAKQGVEKEKVVIQCDEQK